MKKKLGHHSIQITKKKTINIVKKKVIRLTESDLQKIVKRIIREERLNELGGMDDGHPRFGDINFSELSRDEIIRMGRGEEEGSDSVSDEEIDDYYYDEPPMSDQEFEEERRSRLMKQQGRGRSSRSLPLPSGRKPFER